MKEKKKRTKKYSKWYYIVFKEDPILFIYLINIRMQAFLMATKNHDIIVIS